MTATRAARSRPISAYAVIVLALGTIGFLYAAVAPSGRAASSSSQADLIARGNQLFLQGCSSCHGLQGQGSNLAPSLVGVGAAAVDFQVGTGRMPLALRGPEAAVKPPRYEQGDIDAMAAFVESLGGGPEIPTANELNTAGTNLSEGGELFRTNCASCHNFVGKGGALTHGKYAPDLTDTTPKHVYEAMTTGPANMPVFGDKTLNDEQKKAIINYLTTIRSMPDPGGHPLGRIGPVSEGLVGWLVGIGLLVVATVWIGARA
ncbi:MAG: ubiquinol-cytochrome c reductase cytochrome c subunit [Pseudonocardiales bacterium]|nr:ubiquinol-cytochrome c reductase cytochrome c subunit [Pseudonocardiales bacterium]